MKKYRIVDKVQFIKATSIMILMIIESVILISKIHNYGILWFFTTMRWKGKSIMIIIYIIGVMLVLVSIINLIKAYQCLEDANNSLEELIKAKETNLELNLENYEYEGIIKEINVIIFQNGQGSITDRFFKIKEVIKSANKNNF